MELLRTSRCAMPISSHRCDNGSGCGAHVLRRPHDVREQQQLAQEALEHVAPRVRIANCLRLLLVEQGAHQELVQDQLPVVARSLWFMRRHILTQTIKLMLELRHSYPHCDTGCTETDHDRRRAVSVELIHRSMHVWDARI